MSTRCNIVLKSGDMKVYLYHHMDGYPSGVGAYLKQLIKDCDWCILDWVNYLVKNKEDDGYEFTDGIHGDIEYCYVIDADKETLKCFSVYNGENDKQTFEEIRI